MEQQNVFLRPNILELLGPVHAPKHEARIMARLLDFPVRSYLKLAGGFVVAVVVGLALRSRYPYNWRAHETVYALGDGLMVAGIIGILLELFAYNSLIERIGTDITEKLVGSGLPKELQGHIKKIVETDIVRHDYLKTYSFHDPVNGKVKIDITITFQARNYSLSTKPYSPGIDEETFFEPEFTYLQYGIKGEAPHVLDTQALLKLERTNPDTDCKTVEGDVPTPLKSFHTDPSAVCDVTLKYSITMPEQFSDVTAFRAATIGVTLRVDSIPSTLRFVSSGDGMLKPEKGSLSWCYPGCYIGGQHIRSWWFYKAQSVSSKASPLPNP